MFWLVLVALGDEDGLVGYAEFDGVVAVVDCFAAWEAVDGGWAVGAGEHEQGEESGVV
jgi:hypothetical protein